MSNIPYPDVPPLPGVPPLSRAANQGIAVGLAVAAELYALYLKFKNTPVKYPKQSNQYAIWGILYAANFDPNNPEYIVSQGTTNTAKISTNFFTKNTAAKTTATTTNITIKGTYALQPDSFVKFEFKEDHKICSYPVENGSFSSYNKITMPYEIKMTVTKGGIFAITPFINQIKELLDSTKILAIVTPDSTYASASLTNFTYRKEAKNGAVLLIADLTFQEVRVSGGNYVPVAAPQAAVTTPLGQTSPTPFVTTDSSFGTNIPFTPPSFT